MTRENLHKREKNAAVKAVQAETETTRGATGKVWSDEEDVILGHWNESYKGRIAAHLPKKTNKQISSRRCQLKLVRTSTKATTEPRTTEPPMDARLPLVLPAELKDALQESELGRELAGYIDKASLDWKSPDTISGGNDITKRIADAWCSKKPKQTKSKRKRNRHKTDSAKAKAREFRETQTLYCKNRKRLAGKILEGKDQEECPLDVKVVEETYRDHFGGVSKVVNLDHYPPPEGAMDAESVVRPVSAAEVSRAIRGMKIGSAC